LASKFRRCFWPAPTTEPVKSQKARWLTTIQRTGQPEYSGITNWHTKLPNRDDKLFFESAGTAIPTNRFS
jgi:hypothetical protein